MQLHVNVNPYRSWQKFSLYKRMSKKPSEATIKAWISLTRAQRIALVTIESDLKSEKLPPLVWYDVLLEVETADNNGIRPYELEQVMLLEQYNLSRLLLRIEEAGYIQRVQCQEDGRGHKIIITQSGKNIRRKMWSIYSNSIEKTIGQYLSND